MPGNRRKEPNQPERHTGAGYALFQLARALTTEGQHPDAATQKRAHQRAENWAHVFEQIMNGSLAVGSRTPLAGIPGWVTLKVLTGGFATGEMLASGPLEAHEQLLLEKLPPLPEENARWALNSYYLTENGLAELQERLSSGSYAITVPEEGALLVVAWLVQNGHAESARQLLEMIGPWFARLRFYPVPASPAHQSVSKVFLQNVGETAQILKQVSPNPAILAQKEMVCIWTPFYDRAIQLFLETVEGDPPSLQCDADGKWVRDDRGKFPVQGGWPCQHYRDDWFERANALLKEFEIARQANHLCQRPEDKRDNFAQLRGYLSRCTQDPAALQGRDVGRIRQILACYLTKRGAPDSEHCKTQREQQFKHASAPTYLEIAGVLVPRLQGFAPNEGLEDPGSITQPVSETESAQYGLPAGTLVPDTLRSKVQRCMRATVETLIEYGIITSADTLASVLPQITSGIRSASFADPALKRLFAGIYSAFRKRRSLLLLNLEHQIQLEELPWVAAIEPFRQKEIPARDLAYQTLEEVSILTLTAFPHAILPNKLIQELTALAKTAELPQMFVEEVAADIFMGRFSEKFLEAAHLSAGVLAKTLYARYYGIDYRQLPTMRAKTALKLPFLKPTSQNGLAELCANRAGVALGGWNAVINGMVIEQQQILTSQNLAVLFREFKLSEMMGEQLEELARRCFEWICKRLQVKVSNWHAQLIQVKNAAYAWRQMLFFLAMRPSAVQADFFRWAEEYLGQQPLPFQQRFRPALLGLDFAIKGQSLDDPSAVQAGVRRFLGWSKSRHWLLADIEKPDSKG